MQRVTVVRYTTKPDHTAENEALSRAVFAQLRSAPPEAWPTRCFAMAMSSFTCS